MSAASCFIRLVTTAGIIRGVYLHLNKLGSRDLSGNFACDVIPPPYDQRFLCFFFFSFFCAALCRFGSGAELHGVIRGNRDRQNKSLRDKGVFRDLSRKRRIAGQFYQDNAAGIIIPTTPTTTIIIKTTLIYICTNQTPTYARHEKCGRKAQSVVMYKPQES